MKKSSIKIYIHSVTLGFQTREPLETIKMILIALVDIVEDKLKGINAHEFVDAKSESNGKLSSSFANFYQPVRSIPFRKLFKELKLPTNGTFVDIGAGTGKAMLLALELGFKRTKGVELVQKLVEVAQVNMQKYHLRHDEFNCICRDALEYEFEDDDSVFFFNDPFSDEVFSRFIDNLKRFIDKKKTPIILIYKNNSMRSIQSFNNLAKTNKYKTINIWGNFFEVIWITSIINTEHEFMISNQ